MLICVEKFIDTDYFAYIYYMLICVESLLKSLSTQITCITCITPLLQLQKKPAINTIQYKMNTMNMWPSEQLISQIFSKYKVQQTTVKRRNTDIVEWSLVATCDIAIGTFLGFWTGDQDIAYRDSLYAAKLDHMHIYPFANEANITYSERENRPFANMNEPNFGHHANCCFIIQDFRHDEVEGIENIFKYNAARFFRGLACFTCDNVKVGEQLTWYYGKAYEENRSQQGYREGEQCLSLLEGKEFIAENSQAVLAVMHKVPYTCLIAVTGQQKSTRFALPNKKRKKYRSDDDDDSSSSGSGHEIKYKPSTSNNSRNERLNRRLNRRN